jgi:hypothetical protein
VAKETFERMKVVVERYAPPFTVRTGSGKGKDEYDLWSETEVAIASDVFFAAVIDQRGQLARELELYRERGWV